MKQKTRTAKVPRGTTKTKTTKKPVVVSVEDNQEEQELRLNLKQKMFCHYYLNGYEGDDEVDQFRMAMGGRSYALAYKKDYKTQSTLCDIRASQILGNLKVKQYMQKLLDQTGWNDEAVDRRTQQIIFESSDKVSIVAIKHYSEIKGRVTKKLDLTTQGGALQFSGIAALPDEPDDEELENDLDDLDQTTGN